MKEKTIKLCEFFGISEKIKSLEFDLLNIDYVVTVEFDVDNFHECNEIVILAKYDIPINSDNYYQLRANLKKSVIETAKKHGLKKTEDAIEDFGCHFYFVFSAKRF